MLQPIYQAENGVEYGPIFGEETARHIDLIANRGYQVAGLGLNSGDFIKGLTVTFAEINPKNKRSVRWYDSRYVGGVTPGKITRLGSSEMRIVGFHGRAQSLIDAIGLIGRKREGIARAPDAELETTTR